MVQLYVGTMPERKSRWAGLDVYPKRDVRRPALRLHAPLSEKRCAPRSIEAQPQSVPVKRPEIRLQPIVANPMQPYVLRESACAYMECRAEGRRCLATGNRDVTLGYQVAYCLGPRHTSCGHFQKKSQTYRTI
jgi:hypothetical protein